MKTITLLFAGFLILNANLLFAQAPKDTVEIKKSSTFMMNGKKLTPKQLLTITESNAESYAIMKKAKSNYGVGYVFSSAGGFLLGWQLGAALAGGDTNWTSAGIGGGLILFSIPFAAAYTKHARNAVTLYNQGLNKTSFRKVQMYPGFTSDGVGVTMRF